MLAVLLLAGSGHFRVSKSGSMMKRVSFDAFDDLAAWAWSSLRGRDCED
jgi:hypothetical protein